MTKKIVCTELSYYRETYKSGVLNHPDLYKVNKIFHEERLINLSVLLAGTCSTNGTTSLPSNNDAINVLKPSNSPEPETGEKRGQCRTE